MQKPLESWDDEDVVEFIESHDVWKEHSDNFQEEKIDGMMLKGMDLDTLSLYVGDNKRRAGAILSAVKTVLDQQGIHGHTHTHTLSLSHTHSLYFSPLALQARNYVTAITPPYHMTHMFSFYLTHFSNSSSLFARFMVLCPPTVRPCCSFESPYTCIIRFVVC